MKTTMLPEYTDAKSSASADIRFLMDGETGNMLHSTVPPHQINKPTLFGCFFFILLRSYCLFVRV